LLGAPEPGATDVSRIVREFALTVSGADGAGATAYAARVRGAEDGSGVWHGWIEFLPQDGGAALETGRETTQSSFEQLAYWASGLTSAYLEMALDRARRKPPAPPATPTPDVRFAEATARGTHPESAVVRLELETLDATLPLRVMSANEVFEGRVRRIPGGGIVVYDGMEAPEGAPTRHAFLLQYGSANAAAVLANHLWSALHGEGATLLIEGVRVDIDSHQMTERLKALLHVPRP
jgi:hypothetical protein